MYRNISLVVSIILLSSCSINEFEKTNNQNLINKVNIVESQWINYEGETQNSSQMLQSQFIPLKSEKNYILNKDAYVSYYNGDKFIKTELHEDETKLQSIKKADGIILSFNKENKNGIKLISKKKN